MKLPNVIINTIKSRERYSIKNPKRTTLKGDEDLGLYRKYASARGRCNTKSSTSYKYYGGRGISFLWKSYEDFKNDMYESYLEHLDKNGKRQTTLDRINVNGHYCKENCRWATYSVQRLNRRI